MGIRNIHAQIILFYSGNLAIDMVYQEEVIMALTTTHAKYIKYLFVWSAYT